MPAAVTLDLIDLLLSANRKMQLGDKLGALADIQLALAVDPTCLPAQTVASTLAAELAANDPVGLASVFADSGQARLQAAGTGVPLVRLEGTDALAEVLAGLSQHLSVLAEAGEAQRRLLTAQWIGQEQDRIRARDPDSLILHGAKRTSQNDEDGIIAEIFRRIGETNKIFIEIGVGATENNTLDLLWRGWRGWWVDVSHETLAQARAQLARFVGAGALGLMAARIDADSIESVMTAVAAPAEFDLLSIDIDGNDYWVWKALESRRPRVVIVEYNGQHGPESEFVQDYDPNWPGYQANSYFGAALKPLTDLAEAKGYRLVGCNLTGVNAFFVRSDLTEGRFAAPSDVVRHHRPLVWRLARYENLGHDLRLSP